MSEPVTQEWLDSFRQKLIKQGAVSIQPNTTEYDVIASKAMRGMHIALQGLGLYRQKAHSYYKAYFDGNEYASWDKERWRVHFQERDSRLHYLAHWSYSYKSSDVLTCQIVEVHFRIWE